MAGILLAVIGFAAAQSSNPPSGNPAVPLHVGPGVLDTTTGNIVNQYKTGTLTIGAPNPILSATDLEVVGSTGIGAIHETCITPSGCSSTNPLPSGYAAMSTGGMYAASETYFVGGLLMNESMTTGGQQLADLDIGSLTDSLRSQDLENGGQGGRVCADAQGRLIICEEE